jgi:hypothetical protein
MGLVDVRGDRQVEPIVGDVETELISTVPMPSRPYSVSSGSAAAGTWASSNVAPAVARVVSVFIV